MSHEEDTIVQFLIGLGVFTEEDVKTVQEAQAEPIVNVMLERRALNPKDVDEAKELVKELIGSANHMRRLKTQMALVKLVTGKMHERMAASSDRMREHKERITSGNFPVVPALAKISG